MRSLEVKKPSILHMLNTTPSNLTSDAKEIAKQLEGVEAEYLFFCSIFARGYRERKLGR